MSDPYDLQHTETGSSNISKATPEWQEKLALARTLNDGSEPVLHTAYHLVNEAVGRGESWAKCLDCGSPFRGSGEFCSPECGEAFTLDLL
jgi:hypothetical protein